jgi:hypothetical protein
MTDSPRPDGASTASGAADPTRDIRLPALQDRPPSDLPRAWSIRPPSSPQSPAGVAPRSGGADSRRGPLVDLETDDLAAPVSTPRERTIAFASPEAAVGRPKPTVGPTPRRTRRWPWVVLALLPVAVIVASGVWWFLLLRAA